MQSRGTPDAPTKQRRLHGFFVAKPAAAAAAAAAATVAATAHCPEILCKRLNEMEWDAVGRIKHGEKMRRSGPQWDASSMEKN